MTRILAKRTIGIKGSKTVVSFETIGRGRWEFWDRFISIEGKHAYHIGNICDTCYFFFERLGGANQEVELKELVDDLNTGLLKIDKKVLKIISQIIPDGKYEALLLKTIPKLTEPLDENDYFSNDQKALWEVDRYWGLPHNPKVKYYRGIDQRIDKEGKIFEFINPLVPTNLLDPDRVDFYKAKIKDGITPTGIAISVLDIKQPAIWPDDLNTKITEHWCLAHYLLDGHHKIFAANELNKPVTLLAFLSIEEGISTVESIKKLIKEI